METIGKLNAAIYRVSQSLINYKLKDLSIGSGQQDFLYVISKNEGLSQKELSEHLYVGKSTTAKAVKHLIENGYITRKKDDRDKRVYRLYLSELGRQAAPKVRSAFIEIVDLFTKNLSKSEMEQSQAILKKVLAGLCEEKNKISSELD